MNSVSRKVAPAEADGKEFAFEIKSESVTLLANAAREEVREKCILILNMSATDPALPSKPLSSAGESVDMHKRRGSSYVEHNMGKEEERPGKSFFVL